MYASLAECKAELNAAGTVDNDFVRRYERQVCARIDGIMMPGARRTFFAPDYATRQFPLIPTHIDTWHGVYFFNQPLLSFDAVGVGSTDLTPNVEIYPPDAGPAYALRFTDAVHDWYQYCDSAQRYPAFLSITGVWGYHSDYANAWMTVDVVTVADVTPSAIVVNVADVDGDDPNGFAPRFSPGQLVRFGTNSEISEVVDTDATANTITLRRAVNHSPAATGNYTVGTYLQVFQVEDPIRRIVARQAAMLYARKGAFSVDTIDGVGVVSFPQDLLVELKNTLTDYFYT